jgi:hypothetical protein
MELRFAMIEISLPQIQLAGQLRGLGGKLPRELAVDVRRADRGRHGRRDIGRRLIRRFNARWDRADVRCVDAYFRNVAG